MHKSFVVSIIVALICGACSAPDEKSTPPISEAQLIEDVITDGYPFNPDEINAMNDLADRITDTLSNPETGVEDKMRVAVEIDSLQHPGLPPTEFPQTSLESLDKFFNEIESLVELSIQHYQYSELAEVISLGKRIVEKSETVFGKDNELLLPPLLNLGNLYTENDQFQDAEETYQRRVDIVKMRHGPGYEESLHYGLTLEPLVELYDKTFEFKKAKPLAEQTLKTFEKYLGPTNYKVGPVLVLLGGIYQATDQRDKGEQSLLRATELYQNLAVKDETIYELHVEALDALSFFYEVDYLSRSQNPDLDVQYLSDLAGEAHEHAKAIAVVFLGEDHLYTENLNKGIMLNYRGP